MKKLMIFCFLLSPFLCAAQPVTPAGSATHDTYCMLSFTNKLFSIAKVAIKIDYGRDTLLTDQKTRSVYNKVTTYNSIIDAVNFMAQNGWAVASTYVTRINDTNICWYLMKRPFDSGK